MRWPWQRRKTAEYVTSDDADEATEARMQAEDELRRARERTAEVRQIAAQSRAHRRVNHFAELFGQSFGGPR